MYQYKNMEWIYTLCLLHIIAPTFIHTTKDVVEAEVKAVTVPEAKAEVVAILQLQNSPVLNILN